MFSKLSANHKKRQIYNFEDEPPDKKITSDGDILIKQLAEKQRITKVNLEEQLNVKTHFYKSTEVESITNYTSGSRSLEEFNSVCDHIDNVEKLKAYGLSNGEIELLYDYKKGQELMKEKHKNLNDAILKKQLEEIFTKIKQHESETNKQTIKINRIKAETSLAIKPTSIETKLLKFALENEQYSRDKLPGPMDQIKEVEEQFLKDLSPVNVKKIRKKARSLAKQIDELKKPTIKEPIIKNKLEPNKYCDSSKWDLKETPVIKPKDVKVFTCKPQNYYTIRNGEIVKLNPINSQSSSSNQKFVTTKLSTEEIRKIPKFHNYEKGNPSSVLYIKNLPNNTQESELHDVFAEFSNLLKSINIMKGKMRGQAFIEFEAEETAEKVLDLYNGIVFKNKPLIIQFGKRKT